MKKIVGECLITGLIAMDLEFSLVHPDRHPFAATVQNQEDDDFLAQFELNLAVGRRPAIPKDASAVNDGERARLGLALPCVPNIKGHLGEDPAFRVPLNAEPGHGPVDNDFRLRSQAVDREREDRTCPGRAMDKDEQKGEQV